MSIPEDFSLLEKIENIKGAIAEKEKVLVAFSGGVDSTTLAALTFDVLGDDALAVTLNSCAIPQSELDDAKRIAEQIGIRHMVMEHDMLSDDMIRHNHKDRCYFCKKLVMSTLKDVMEREGLNVIVEGTNASEITGRRPGWAAINEARGMVMTPYTEFGVTKSEVRQIARHLGLDVADKVSNACLLSRLPYDTEVTPQSLRRIEQAEDFLFSLGISHVRVRDHNGIARIEVLPADFPVVNENRKELLSRFMELGYSYVTLDMEGFRSGSMDEVL
ncbi:ATP-dependent sacrificial sulfur transferase LarE [Methanococcoides sp. LMO-2]|uniref:ATP-dependent sacrificial sulfur transferase LarE n=1 Tax=Methanococcoides cohabitans TaxID=3136559 RepID=A0ABU9KTF7_9EURY